MKLDEIARLLAKETGYKPQTVVVSKRMHDKIAAITGQRADALIVDDPYAGCPRCGAHDGIAHAAFCCAQQLARGTFRHFDDGTCFDEAWRAAQAAEKWTALGSSFASFERGKHDDMVDVITRMNTKIASSLGVEFAMLKDLP